MGSNNVTCVVKTQAPFYIAGDIVNGAVYFDTKKSFSMQRILILIEGNQQTWWKGSPTYKSNESNNIKKESAGRTKLLDTNFLLYEWGGNNTIKGQFSFPFSFHLPNFLPGSFEQKKSDYYGSIKYRIKAICIPTKNGNNIEAEQELILREHKKTYEKSLYGQILLHPASCFVRKGQTKISCFFDKNYYIRGDQSTIICQVDNTKSNVPIQEIKCQLIKTITLRAFLGQTKVFTESISNINFPGIKAKDGYTGQNALRQKISLKCKDSINPIHPSSYGQLVRCEYSIRVSPKFSGCCLTGQGTFEVKIMILHEGLKFEYPQEPEGWDPKVFNKSEILLNYGQKNELLESMGSNVNPYPMI